MFPTFVCLNTWSLFLDISLCALLISGPSYKQHTVHGCSAIRFFITHQQVFQTRTKRLADSLLLWQSPVCWITTWIVRINNVPVRSFPHETIIIQIKQEKQSRQYKNISPRYVHYYCLNPLIYLIGVASKAIHKY